MESAYAGSDAILSFDEAVRFVVRRHGTDILRSPKRFVGCVADLVDAESVELRLLHVACDEQYLKLFADGLDKNDQHAVDDAAKRAVEYLCSECIMDRSIATSVSSGIARGVGRAFNLPNGLATGATMARAQSERASTSGAMPSGGRVASQGPDPRAVREPSPEHVILGMGEPKARGGRRAPQVRSASTLRGVSWREGRRIGDDVYFQLKYDRFQKGVHHVEVESRGRRWEEFIYLPARTGVLVRMSCQGLGGDDYDVIVDKRYVKRDR